MKHLISILAVALIAGGCSPKKDSTTGQSPASLAADLGKGEEYFKNLYGAPKSEKRVAEYAFSLPNYGAMIHLTRPLIVQQYEKDRLKATVICSETARQVIWVKYALPDPWTQDQINAALNAYGADWKIVQNDLAMNFVLRERAPVVYLSSAGNLAYKTMVNELIVYAPQLWVDLKNQIEEADRQKKAVPKF